LKVLVACEESQRVCIAFRERGHEAYSCDLQDCSGGHPEWHIKGDALETIKSCEWDLIIAHPPCTYLSNAGACRLYPKAGELDMDRFRKGLAAKEFFLEIYNANCKRIAIENPIPSSVYSLPPYSQIIEPYEHGDPYTKKTCLWLKGLPELVPTNIVKPIGPYVCGNAEIWKRQAANGVVIGKEKSQKHRSKTFPGIARAMAEQWGDPGAYKKELMCYEQLSIVF